MYIHVNPNPKNKNTGDCAIRAIAIIMDMSWDEAYIELCTEGLYMSDLPNANSVWSAYLMRHGFKRDVIPNTCPDCYTIADFCRDHPTGEYVVCTGSHVVAVIDGSVYDAWDSSNEVPAYYFYKEREERAA